MMSSPSSPSTPQPPPLRDAAWAQRQLKAHGLRVTQPRISLLVCLAQQPQPLSHSQLLQALSQPLSTLPSAPAAPIDRVTLYRNLGGLVEANLLVRLQLGEPTWHYALHPHLLQGLGPIGPLAKGQAAAALTLPHAHGEGQHPHFVCVTCHQLMCLPMVLQVALEELKAACNTHGVAQVQEVLLRGTCSDCS